MISLAPFSVPIKNLRFMASVASGRDNILLTCSGRLTAKKTSVFLPRFVPKMNRSTCPRTVYRRTQSTDHRMVHLVHWYTVHLFRVTA